MSQNVGRMRGQSASVRADDSVALEFRSLLRRGHA